MDCLRPFDGSDARRLQIAWKRRNTVECIANIFFELSEIGARLCFQANTAEAFAGVRVIATKVINILDGRLNPLNDLLLNLFWRCARPGQGYLYQGKLNDGLHFFFDRCPGDQTGHNNEDHQ